MQKVEGESIGNAVQELPPVEILCSALKKQRQSRIIHAGVFALDAAKTLEIKINRWDGATFEIKGMHLWEAFLQMENSPQQMGGIGIIERQTSIKCTEQMVRHAVVDVDQVTSDALVAEKGREIIRLRMSAVIGVQLGE